MGDFQVTPLGEPFHCRYCGTRFNNRHPVGGHSVRCPGCGHRTTALVHHHSAYSFHPIDFFFLEEALIVLTGARRSDLDLHVDLVSEVVHRNLLLHCFAEIESTIPPQAGDDVDYIIEQLVDAVRASLPPLARWHVERAAIACGHCSPGASEFDERVTLSALTAHLHLARVLFESGV